MNPPFEHGEPEDGDLVDAEQISKSRPRSKRRSGRSSAGLATIQTAKGSSTRRAGSPAPGENMRAGIKKILPCISAGRSRRLAAMTRSSF